LWNSLPKKNSTKLRKNADQWAAGTCTHISQLPIFDIFLRFLVSFDEAIHHRKEGLGRHRFRAFPEVLNHAFVRLFGCLCVLENLYLKKKAEEGAAEKR